MQSDNTVAVAVPLVMLLLIVIVVAIIVVLCVIYFMKRNIKKAGKQSLITDWT